jgi:polysaccharide biosynthesis protein PslH
MKILYLTTLLPRTRSNGGEIASQYFIDALEKSGGDVTVIGYQRLGGGYQPQGNEILIDERPIETNGAKYHALLWMARSLWMNLPFSVAKYYSSRYVRIVRQLIDRHDYDLILIDRAQMGWLEPIIDRKDKIVFCAHNIESKIYAENADFSKNKLMRTIYRRDANLIHKIERKLAMTAAQTWTLTTEDRDYFAEFAPSADRVVTIDIPSPQSPQSPSPHSPVTEQRFDICSIGSWTWKANRVGLEWFFEYVYPLLPPDLSIAIAGRGADWLENKYANVRYCDFVPSVAEFVSQGRIVVIPSISGSGIQIKTLDAIALGATIVATPVALRGIEDYPATVVVAETPAAFADSLMKLLDSSTAAERERNVAAARQWSIERREKFFATVKQQVEAIVGRSSSNY